MPVSPAKRDDAEEAEKEKEKEENEQEEKSNGSPSTTTTAARSGRVEAVINVKPVGRNHLSLSLTNPLTDNRISFLYGGGGGGSEIGSGRVHRTSSLSESTQASTANRYFASPTSPSFLHLGQLKTGVVSRVIRAISDSRFMRSRMFKHSAAPMHWCHPPTQPLRHQVRTLAKDFEDGAADHIGPLKLYHAETYKRELRKITSNKLGRVFRRIRCFEFLSTTEKLLSDQQLAQVQSKELPQLSSPPDQTPHVPKVSTAPNLAPKSGNDRRFSRKESFIAAVTKNKAQCLGNP
ncbi:unnamed protein product [Soboliphyme baturini]|uniref:Uncharacterized protein n=1 Tax=Soboliphyme baturini TaxID=241478 RepID=A0A183IHR4_9BILA|nr:unnamed protein product [Soboliphyme baturini]